MTVTDSEVAVWGEERAAATAVSPPRAVAGVPATAVMRDPRDFEPVESFGELVAISRFGGQGRVYRPAQVPASLGPEPVVVKLYRRPPPPAGAEVLADMVSWGGSLDAQRWLGLRHVAAWPVRVVSANGLPVGIAMQDVSDRFSVPFVMPSGRRDRVLLALEHLLGADSYLQLRGLDVRLDTATRAKVAERVSGALAVLHRHAVVASDIAPSNLLVAIRDGVADVCLIDCDSMVFRGRQALASVETGDWNVPSSFGEPPRTRATDAYKLGLVVLRLFARSHDARTVAPHLRHVPVDLRDLLYRTLASDAANRPPAGEWQRALRQVLADGRLNERYPGPVPAPPLAPRPQVPAPPRRAPVGARPASGQAYSSIPRRAVPPAPAPQPGGLRFAVLVAWLVALALVTGLVISRLLAAAAPVQDGGGFGSGIPAGAGQPTPYFRYYGPPSGGQGIPYVPYQ